jgi:hypothetical protein
MNSEAFDEKNKWFVRFRVIKYSSRTIDISRMIFVEIEVNEVEYLVQADAAIEG